MLHLLVAATGEDEQNPTPLMSSTTYQTQYLWAAQSVLDVCDVTSSLGLIHTTVSERKSKDINVHIFMDCNLQHVERLVQRYRLEKETQTITEEKKIKNTEIFYLSLIHI